MADPPVALMPSPIHPAPASTISRTRSIDVLLASLLG
jgi:hypothetical protein